MNQRYNKCPNHLFGSVLHSRHLIGHISQSAATASTACDLCQMSCIKDSLTSLDDAWGREKFLLPQLHRLFLHRVFSNVRPACIRSIPSDQPCSTPAHPGKLEIKRERSCVNPRDPRGIVRHSLKRGFLCSSSVRKSGGLQSCQA